jgi:hypothetical protein
MRSPLRFVVCFENGCANIGFGSSDLAMRDYDVNRRGTPVAD